MREEIIMLFDPVRKQGPKVCFVRGLMNRVDVERDTEFSGRGCTRSSA